MMSSSNLIMTVGASVARHLTAREHAVAGFFPGRPRRHRARAAARPRARRHRLHSGGRGRPKGLACCPSTACSTRVAAGARPVDRVDGASVGAGAWRRWPSPTARSPRSPAARLRARPELRGEAGAQDVAEAITRIALAVLDGQALEVREGVSLTVITSRARGPLHGRESKLAFARATLSNALSRERLATYLERVLFVAGRPGSWRSLSTSSAWSACRSTAATATRHCRPRHHPLLCSPVRDISGAGRLLLGRGAGGLPPAAALPAADPGRAAPPHRLLPAFQRLRHPGWLDKHLPWRKHRAPTPGSRTCCWWPLAAFLARLPNASCRTGRISTATARTTRRASGLGARHRGMRAVRRGRAALAGAAGPHSVAAHLTRYHLAMDHSPARRVELIRHPGSASAGVVKRIDVEISNTADGRCACAISWTAT